VPTPNNMAYKAEPAKQREENDCIFIGRAWVNKTQTGKEEISFKMDDLCNIAVKEGEAPLQIDAITVLQILQDEMAKPREERKIYIAFYQNTKREGKQDADYRVRMNLPLGIIEKAPAEPEAK